MKKYSKRVLMYSVLLISLNLLPNILKATTPGDTGITDPDAPIDGGVGLLVAAGIGYGYKKFRENNKKKFII